MYTTLKICYWFLKFLEELYVKYLLNNEKTEGVFGFLCVRAGANHSRIYKGLRIFKNSITWNKLAINLI